jgi:hypothetical protein
VVARSPPADRDGSEVPERVFHRALAGIPAGDACPNPDGGSRTPDYARCMQESPVQIFEVRAGAGDGPVTITVAVSGAASQAMFTALSEQLDRRRRTEIDTVDEVLALREQTAFVERFEPLAAADAHAVVSFTDSELRGCLFELAAYADRVNGDHFQPNELRDRLAVLAEITPTLWDANAAAAASAEPLSETATLP